MNPLRAVWADLVEKRLWPLALLLLAALAAVPFLLGGDRTAPDPASVPAALADAHTAGATPDGGAATVGGGNADGQETAVVRVASGADRTRLRGSRTNPFRVHRPPRPKLRVSAATAGRTAGGDETTGAPRSPGGDAGGGSGGSGGAAPGHGRARPKDDGPGGDPAATIAVRFGRAGTQLTKIDAIPRLTPLPSAERPIVIYLGLRRDGETAVFMVSSDVRAQGEGRCVPSRATCEAIELRAGQIAFLDHTGDDGAVTQYELDLLTVDVP